MFHSRSLPQSSEKIIASNPVTTAITTGSIIVDPGGLGSVAIPFAVFSYAPPPALITVSEAGTIARELQLIKHTFLLAKKSSPPKIHIVPHIRIPEEKNVRQGFLERDHFETLLHHLPPYLRPVAQFGYITGWRLSDGLSRCWRHVNFEQGTVVMEQYETKSGEGTNVSDG